MTVQVPSLGAVSLTADDLVVTQTPLEGWGVATAAGETVALDARPSDAIALALRWDCPIYASRAVLENARQVSEGPQNATADEMRRWLENLNDDDLGRYKM